MKTLTASAKRRITADWLALFPDFGVYKPLHLLRRAGPLLEGIALDRTSGNDEYRPTFHVHCLLRESSVVTLTLYQRLLHERSGADDVVSVQYHERKFADAARRLALQSPLSLSGEVRLSDVLEAYRRYACRPGIHYDANVLYEEMAKLCAWSGDDLGARRIIDEGFGKMAEWPSEILDKIRGRATWRDELVASVSNRAMLSATLEHQVRALGLETVPVSEIVLT